MSVARFYHDITRPAILVKSFYASSHFAGGNFETCEVFVTAQRVAIWVASGCACRYTKIREGPEKCQKTT